jgi:hypothetical protein
LAAEVILALVGEAYSVGVFRFFALSAMVVLVRSWFLAFCAMAALGVRRWHWAWWRAAA